MKKFRTIITILILLFYFTTGMTVNAEGTTEESTTSAETGTTETVESSSEIWLESNTSNFAFYDNLYTENSHIAVKPANLNDLIDLNMNENYKVSIVMRLDKENQETPIIIDNVYDSSNMYGYTISNYLLKTTVSYLDLYTYETDGYAIDFIITIKSGDEDYTINCVVPSVYEFTDFNTNMQQQGDLKENMINEKKLIATVVTLALFMIIIISAVIITVSTKMERYNAKRKYVKALYLPYQIFTKIKKNTDNDMIFRIQHTNKTGSVEYIALKRILEGVEIPNTVSDETENDTVNDNDDKEEPTDE